MALQHRQRQGRLGEDPDGLGPAYVDRVGVALAGQAGGDPVAHRDEEDHVSRVGPHDQGLQPELVGLAGGDEPVQRVREAPGLRGLGVGLDDPGLDQRGEPAPGQRVQVGGHGRVDRVSLRQRQSGGAGQVGDLAGLPHPALPRTQGRPQGRVAVAQVQRVPDQVVRADRAGAQQHPELGTGELGHHRRAVPTAPLGPLHPGEHRTGPDRHGVLVVQVRPVRGQSELAPLRLAEVGLGARDRPARRIGVQVGDPRGVEHVFESISIQPTPSRPFPLVHKGEPAQSPRWTKGQPSVALRIAVPGTRAPRSGPQPPQTRSWPAGHSGSSSPVIRNPARARCPTQSPSVRWCSA